MKRPSSLWLSSLFTFFSVVQLNHGINVGSRPYEMSTANEALDPNVCSVQAWVRAPDLNPGEIIPGQVKVRTNGPCDLISEYSLILRFKERVWVKYRPSDNLNANTEASARGIVSPNGPQDLFRKLNRERKEQMYLWPSAEEERVAFESRYKLFEGHRSEINAIHNFALLVPTTNYPPTKKTADSVKILPNVFSSGERNRFNEHISLYVVEVKFVNGTIIETPAGYTSFSNIGLNLRSAAPDVVTFPAIFKDKHLAGPGVYAPSDFSHLTFNINVTFPKGRDLEQGSTHDLMVTWAPSDDWNKDDYDIILYQPEITEVQLASQPRHMDTLPWDPELEQNATTSMRFTFNQVIPTDPSPHNRGSSSRKPLWHNDNCCKPKNSTWDTSATSVVLHISQTAFPSFDMYYQSLEAKLSVTLSLQQRDPVPNPDIAPKNENEDNYDWTPRKVYPAPLRFQVHHFYTEIPVTIQPSPARTKLAESDADVSMTHYLSPDARQPLFVDPSTSSVTRLLQLTVEERDLLAPKCNPVIINSMNGKEVPHNRYSQNRLYYVGDTWLRKVLSKRGSQRFAETLHKTEQRDAHALLVQVQTGL